MDDKTAYKILKLRPGTSIEKISKRHDHFVKLYKRHLMGEKLNISSVEIEEMKLAYEHFLYKEISNEELMDLYPVESKSLSHQIWRKSIEISAPFIQKHRAKVIYTVVMIFLTCAIIAIRNYQPVDLRIAFLGYAPKSETDYQKINRGLLAFEAEILANNKSVKRPMIYYYPITDFSSSLTTYYSAANIDVFIIEKSLKNKLEEVGVRFLAIDIQSIQDTCQAFDPIQHGNRFATEILINKQTILYQNLCNNQNNDKPWVAALSPNVRNKEKAMAILGFYFVGP